MSGNFKRFFSLNSIAQKTKDILGKTLPYEANISNISFVFWPIEIQEKLLLRFMYKPLAYIGNAYIVRQLFKGDNYSREETINY